MYMNEHTRENVLLGLCSGLFGRMSHVVVFPLELPRVYKEIASSCSGTSGVKWKAVMLLQGASQGQHLNFQESSVLRTQDFSLLRTPSP